MSPIALPILRMALALLALAQAMPARAQAPPAPPEGASGRAEIAETTFDAGTVARGTEIVHEFVVRNAGTGPLLLDAKPACGCTVTDFDKSIAAGATGRLKATVQTATFKGPIAKDIALSTSDPKTPKVTLQVKANVVVPVDFEPSGFVSWKGKNATFQPKEVVLAAAGGETFDIVSVTPQDALFSATATALPASGAPGPPRAGTVASGASRYKITVFPGAGLPVGRIASSVAVATTHPKVREATVRIVGEVVGEIDVVPSRISLSTGPTATAQARVQRVALRKPTGAPFSVLEAASDNADVVTTVTTTTQGREYAIEVRYIGAPTEVALVAQVTIRTDDERQPVLEIPVWGRVDPGMRPSLARPGAPVAAPAPPAGPAPARGPPAP